jgi:hypothetical protein
VNGIGKEQKHSVDGKGHAFLFQIRCQVMSNMRVSNVILRQVSDKDKASDGFATRLCDSALDAKATRTLRLEAWLQPGWSDATKPYFSKGLGGVLASPGWPAFSIAGSYPSSEEGL